MSLTWLIVLHKNQGFFSIKVQFYKAKGLSIAGLGALKNFGPEADI